MSEIDELLTPEPHAGGMTPAWNLPYPGSDDPVAAGASNIQALAEAVDNALLQSRALIVDSGPFPAPVNSFTIDNIPQTYEHLVLEMMLRSLATTGAYGRLYYTINGDAVPANYVGPGTAAGINGGHISDNFCAARSDPATLFSRYKLIFPHYRDTTRQRLVTIWNYASVDTPPTKGGYWKNTAAITSLTFRDASGNLDVGCRYWLYGAQWPYGPLL